MPIDKVQQMPSLSDPPPGLIDVEVDGEARGVVQLHPGWIDQTERSGLATAFASSGFHCCIQTDAFVPGGPRPSADALLASARTTREHIAQRHPGLPVILVGYGFGAILAAAALAQQSERFDAAVFWHIPVITPLKNKLLLAVLGWERFRMGSDVSSRLVRLENLPPTIGLAISTLHLNRSLAGKGPLQNVPKKLPICLALRGRVPDAFGHAGFLNLETVTCRQNHIHELNTLNQDMSRKIVEWTLGILKRAGGSLSPS